MKYDEYLNSKPIGVEDAGFECGDINHMLFGFQRDIVKWAVKKGRAAIFADCGLGKTPMQIEWARHICEHTGGKVLIVAPLAVSDQTIREGDKFCVKVSRVGSGNIQIINYEQIHNVDISEYVGIVLDESSILKSKTGKYRTELISRTKHVKYKLACTATPAPNDFIELGNHSEFLGVMTEPQMLAMFFINDSGHVGKWRLKGHAEDKYWQWLTEWAVMIRKPSDIGYSDEGFALPPIEYIEHVLPSAPPSGELFATVANTLHERRVARAGSIDGRVAMAADIINNHDGPSIAWCNLNAESDLLTENIDGAIQIKGSDDHDVKAARMLGFSSGDISRLVTKPTIAGFGMNWQHCNVAVFVGLSDSYEQFYQAVRRVWRFGQENTVKIYIIISESEGRVLDNIKRKEEDADKMAASMVKHMKDLSTAKINTGSRDVGGDYEPKIHTTSGYMLINGDSIVETARVESDSVGLSVFSPPFVSLFTYSNNNRDLGNSRGPDDFFAHFSFLIDEIYRIMMPGRIVAIHCMNLSTTKSQSGHIGLYDFRGDIIRAFTGHGFIYHSEVVIWKDPLVQAVRTKALPLAHKQISKDAARCGMGIPDYIVVMRKPGDNPEPVAKGRGFESYIGERDEPAAGKTNDPRTNKYSHHVWQRYASPVWFDINQTDTLNFRAAREDKDEKHICPLQLDVIRRVVELWSNPGDLVYSPFMGIGSEGYVSVEMGRKFTGIELKGSYFDAAVKNIDSVNRSIQGSIFGAS